MVGCGRGRTNGKLLDDSGSSKDRGGLEGQHGVLTLAKRLENKRGGGGQSLAYVEAGQALAIGVELVVVELDELLWTRISSKN